jgi:hypothetical protein
MNSGKLRIGILLDSYQVPAWIYHSIERVVKSNFAEFSLIVLRENSNVNNENDRILKGKKTIVYQIFNTIDERLFIRGDNASEIMNAEKLFTGVPVIKVKPIKKGLENYIEPKNIDEIRGYGLDLFVKIGFDTLRGDILVASKYGMWTYWFKGNPHGFWEVMKGLPETKENLLILNEDSNGGRLIYSSSSFTYPFSPARNRNRSLWKSSSFLPRQIALLHFLGEKKFIVETEKYRKGEDPHNQKGSEIPPSNLLCLWLIIKLLIKDICEMFSRVFYLGEWFLMFDLGTNGAIPFKDFKTIIPPKDRFWADPNVIQKDNRFFVFVEEYVFKMKKAHLSVFEVDQSGKHTMPVRVLEKEYHLSYPYVFEWNGRYYMVPESAENRTIDLYECIEFPYKWVHTMTLKENIKAVDTTLLFYHGKWWLFTGISENEGSFPDVELFLFFSDDLFTRDWKAHPLNPIVSDVKKARPAGRIFTRNGKLFRPSQDCSISYGYGFDLNEILVLSETEYREEDAVAVRPDWDKKISATHTYGIEGQFQIIDARTTRRKFL